MEREGIKLEVESFKVSIEEGTLGYVVKSLVMEQSLYRDRNKERRKFDREVWRQGRWGGFTEGFLPSSETT